MNFSARRIFFVAAIAAVAALIFAGERVPTVPVVPVALVPASFAAADDAPQKPFVIVDAKSGGQWSLVSGQRKETAGILETLTGAPPLPAEDELRKILTGGGVTGGDTAGNDAQRNAVRTVLDTAALGKKTPFGRKPADVAAALLKLNPQLAPAVVSALLRHDSPADAGSARAGSDAVLPAVILEPLLALPDGLLAQVAGAYREFPNRLDSAFLRTVATGKKPLAARAAAALLASRHCVKNDRALEALADVLEKGEEQTVAAVLNTFISDSEFARVAGATSRSSEDGMSNDRFGDLGSAPASFLGEINSEFRYARRRVGAHISRDQWPSIAAIIKFLGALDRTASPRKFSGRLANNAYAVLLCESGLSQTGDILHRLLVPRARAAGGANLAWKIALRNISEPRLLEIVLMTASGPDGATMPLPRDFFDALPPNLVRDDAERSRIFATAGRRFALSEEPLRRALAFVLLSAHGAPRDAALTLRPASTAAGVTSPFAPINDSNRAVRLAARFALARLAPEVFARHAAAFAKDADADARELVPLAFYRAGFRREHAFGREFAGVPNFAQWAKALPAVNLPAGIEPLLRQLAAGDPAPSVRRLALLALLQHGLLSDPAPLLALCSENAPANSPSLCTAELTLSIAAARAAGNKPPAALEPFTPVDDVSGALAVLLIFVDPLKTDLRSLDIAVEGFREMLPNARAVFRFRDAAGAAALRRLAEVFPLSAGDIRAPAIVFSAGGWFAATDGRTAPDFAMLCELAAAAENGDRKFFNKTFLTAEERPRPESAFRRSTGEMLTGIAPVAETQKNEEDARREHERLLGTDAFLRYAIYAIVAGILVIIGSLLWRLWNHLPTHRAEKRQRTQSAKKNP